MSNVTITGKGFAAGYIITIIIGILLAHFEARPAVVASLVATAVVVLIFALARKRRRVSPSDPDRAPSRDTDTP
jgi:hypothetical protein